jgi:hypothetical protein
MEVPQRQKLQAPGPHPPARSPRAGQRARQGFRRCGQATGSRLPLARGQPASRVFCSSSSLSGVGRRGHVEELEG